MESKKTEANRAAKIVTAQEAAKNKAAIEQKIAEANAAPKPNVKSILYVFEDGSIVGGSPTTLQLVQDGDNIQAINVVSREGDKFTYNAVATFIGLKMQKVEAAKPSAAQAALQTAQAPR